ncbi:MAG: phosphotransferase enzyme family protein [Ignavibacteriae bacterium]|nr:MAG: phosphotransferase enzyme family protein [Ignavibacteriota bacterium]
MIEQLKVIFEKWAGEKVKSITPLPQSGSYRQYFRMISANHQAIGVYNPDKNENNAFITFTKHFLKHNLNVPRLYESDIDKNVYLIEDLGEETLFSFITKNRTGEEFPNKIKEHYKIALTELVRFQIDAFEELDLSVCYPSSSFDKQSMLWDLHYFKYYFLKLTQTPFDEQKLEDDFTTLIDFLLSTDVDFFMYRDFQSRNIMLKNDELYFIDYQGGRKGALHYDVASLLYDAKADIPQLVRDELLEHYFLVLNQKMKVDRKEFEKYYYGYVLIRILQAMGAYGFRGIHEKKAHFLKSIPYAVNNIEYLLSNNLLPEGLKELNSALEHIINSRSFRKFESIEDSEKLTVSINSFSYKSSIPVDLSGNGGGFVFDCRSLHNPGRYDEFKMLSGKDEAVIEFLNKQSDVKEFLTDITSIIKRAINNYTQRGFSHLMINFGCTGGQHRSVFCAERLAEYINKSFDVNVILQHTELEKKDMLK